MGVGASSNGVLLVVVEEAPSTNLVIDIFEFICLEC
jgi:hypothetical protein